ncbi:MAG: hypothetical protein WCB67_08640 [Solirubrobacteraceae bacterium]
MSAYPDLPAARARAMFSDAMALGLLIVFAWLGIRVHHDVDQLSGLGTGVIDAGHAVRSGFASAASAASGVPLAGDAIASALRSAAGTTSQNIVAVGQAGAASAHRLALILGLLMWAIPSVTLVSLLLPRRVMEIRRLRRLRLAQRGPDSEARRRLLALRAILALPEEVLFAYSPDPAGDVLQGQYEQIAAAALEANGLRADFMP